MDRMHGRGWNRGISHWLVWHQPGPGSCRPVSCILSIMSTCARILSILAVLSTRRHGPQRSRNGPPIVCILPIAVGISSSCSSRQGHLHVQMFRLGQKRPEQNMNIACLSYGQFGRH